MAMNATDSQSQSQPPDQETLDLLSAIQANRHKLDPESQSLFDGIVQKVGARHVPGTVANRSMTRVPDRRGDYVEPTGGERAWDAVASVAEGGLDFAHDLTVSPLQTAYRVGSVPVRAVAAGAAEVGSKLGGGTWEDADQERNAAWRVEGPYVTPNLDQARALQSPADAGGRMIRSGAGVRPNAILDTQHTAVREGTKLAANAAMLGGPAASDALAARAAARESAAAKMSAEDLPEVQRLVRATGGAGVDFERGVHAPRGTARAGIVFDPKNPAKFVQDHEAAINHAKLAQDQLLAQPDGAEPSIATDVALKELDRMSQGTRMQPGEAEGVARLRATIESKGDLISASDLHNAMEVQGKNLPSAIKRGFRPMINANVPGYSDLSHHMGDLYEGRGVANTIAKKVLGGNKAPNRIAAGARTLSRAAHGDVSGAIDAAGDAAGGSANMTVDVKGLAKSTKAAADAVKRHAQAQGLYSGNPSLNAVQAASGAQAEPVMPSDTGTGTGSSPGTGSSVPERAQFAASDTGEVVPNSLSTYGPDTRPGDTRSPSADSPAPYMPVTRQNNRPPGYQPRLQAPAGPAPRLLGPATAEGNDLATALSPADSISSRRLLGPQTVDPIGSDVGTWVSPQTRPQRALGPVSGPSVNVTPQITGPGRPFIAPRQATGPFFWNEPRGIRIPGSQRVGPINPPSLFRVPERAQTPITESPVIADVGSGVTADAHRAWYEKVKAMTAQQLDEQIARDAEDQAARMAARGDETSTTITNPQGIGPKVPVNTAPKPGSVVAESTSASAPDPAPSSAGRTPEPQSAAPAPEAAREASSGTGSGSDAPVLDQTYAKGQVAEYTVGNRRGSGKILSDSVQTSGKHGPWVYVSDSMTGGKRAILVKNLTLKSSKNGKM